ncbi:MAG: helix-turn-helix transcriptional regulator [Pirellulales bacterium]|nr:helix-turn-helix transcriptional regulator [Pirellulales bacterium]
MKLLSPDALERAAGCLRVLGHPARIRMIEILALGPRPVHQLAELCDLPPHQACEHLRLMKSHGLLAARRHGRSVHYEIADPRLPRLLECIRAHCEE